MLYNYEQNIFLIEISNLIILENIIYEYYHHCYYRTRYIYIYVHNICKISEYNFMAVAHIYKIKIIKYIIL